MYICMRFCPGEAGALIENLRVEDEDEPSES